MGKNKLITIATLFLFLGLIGLISAAPGLNPANITIQAPSLGGVLGGADAIFNCTIPNAAVIQVENYTNISIYLVSAGKTANTTEILVASFRNDTNMSYNGTFDSRVLQDGSDYTFKCMFNNQSAGAWDGGINQTTTVIIDNSIPVAPSSLSPSSDTILSSSAIQTFSATVDDANTTECTYIISKNGANTGDEYFTGSAGYSGSTCSFDKTFDSVTQNGNWLWYITASDGRNTTSTVPNTLQVNLAGSGNAPAGGGTSGTSGTSGGVSGGFSTINLEGFQNLLSNKWVLIGIAIVVIYFVTKKK